MLASEEGKVFGTRHKSVGQVAGVPDTVESLKHQNELLHVEIAKLKDRVNRMSFRRSKNLGAARGTNASFGRGTSSHLATRETHEEVEHEQQVCVCVCVCV